MKSFKLFLIAFLFANICSAQNEVKIAHWEDNGFVYSFPEGIQENIPPLLEEYLGTEGTLDSILINDPEPENAESIPYLILQSQFLI